MNNNALIVVRPLKDFSTLAQMIDDLQEFFFKK